MQPDNIDDLFRDQLNGHATPPGEDVWARLATGLATGKDVPAPAEEAVDATFRAGLGQYASPVRRELWERLEDEHLRPRQRRRAAFWPLALAASLALLLVGGAGWWLREGNLRPATVAGAKPAKQAPRAQRGLATPSVAAASKQMAPAATATSTTVGASTAADAAAASTAAAVATAAVAARAAAATALATKNATLGTGRAVAKATRQTGRENNFTAQNRAPRAAWAVLAGANEATTGHPTKKVDGRATRAGQPASNAPTGTENGLAARPAPANPAPQTAAAALTPQPDAAGVTLAPNPTSMPALALASPAGTIEVDVKPGSAARPAERASQAPAVAFGLAERRGSRAGRVLGGLLRQATNLAQGEPLNLADATGHGPSQTLRLSAHVAGRTLSKSIQL